MKALLKFTNSIPRLSLRASLLLIFLIYLSVFLLPSSVDIFASVFLLAFTVAFLLFFFWICLAYQRTKAQLSLELHLPQETTQAGSAEIRAGEENVLLEKIKGLHLLPFCKLKMQLQCLEQGAISEEHLFLGNSSYGKDDSSLTLVDTLSFPHRGAWKLRGFRCQLEDAFGLFRVQWEIPSEAFACTEIFVSPHRYQGSRLPLRASLEQAGDTYASQDKRLGDPYDLKPYHPSDGARRIHWKTYARTRELISRQPEAASNPEGNAVIFSLGGAGADRTADACFQYLAWLEELDIEYSYFCEGASQEKTPVKTVTEARKLNLESVWNFPRSTSEAISDLERLKVESMKNFQTRQLSQLILFAPRPDRQEAEKLSALGGHCENSNIKPLFFLIAESGRAAVVGKAEVGIPFYQQSLQHGWEVEEGRAGEV